MNTEVKAHDIKKDCIIIAIFVDSCIKMLKDMN